MTAPFEKDQIVRNKKDGRRATVVKVHFQTTKDPETKKSAREYTQVSVRVHPTQFVHGYVNSAWMIEDVMSEADYDKWAERRGIPTDTNPGPADPDAPQLENPAAVPPAQRGGETGGEGEGQ